MIHSEAFADLNPAQREAATFGEPSPGGGVRAAPLLVIAGAGTGKTSTLAHRVAHLLLSGVAPERLLLLTFTRRAALEMTRRAQGVVAGAMARSRGGTTPPASVRLPWSGTFHAIGNRLIRQHASRLGLDPSFSILDRGDAADLMDVERQRLGLSKTEKRFPRKDTCLGIYSHRVNTQRSLRETLETAYPWCLDWEDELTTLCRAYVEAKLSQQALDYDDLLLYWQVMMRDTALSSAIGAQFDHVLVDEYQDTNAMQAAILLGLKPDGRGLTVVGDDAQAIYSFRGATVDNILDFPGKFPAPAHVVTLEENYRSGQAVLDAANALMAEGGRQYRKYLRSSRGVGAKPRYVTVLDDQAQAGYVVERVLEARERGVELRRQAVLFRNSDHSDVLELELMRRNIPFVKYGGLKFLEAAHVKDLLAVLRWADNPRNRIAAFRVLQLLPGMGPANSARACEAFEAAGFRWPALTAHTVPAAAREHWAALAGLMEMLAGDAPWEGQVTRVRAWYEPQLERLVRGGAGPPWRSRATRAARGAVRNARVLRHGADVGSPAGERRPCGRPSARRGLPRAVDRALRQGPGMGGRARAQRHGWQLSVGVRDRTAGTGRRGAAPALRGHDAGPPGTAPARAATLLRDAAGAHGRPLRARGRQPVHDRVGARAVRTHRLAARARPARRGASRQRAEDRRRGAAARHVVKVPAASL